jgi:hypothetical protein
MNPRSGRPALPPEQNLARALPHSPELPVGREAFTLPLTLVTVAGLGGVRVAADGRLAFVPPTLVALVLAVLLLAAMVQAGALAPERLAGPERRPLANASGVTVLVALLLAAAQVFTLLTPPAGLLAFVFSAFFLLLLWNTLAVGPSRRQLLRSLAVVFGGAFLLKFVVLAGVYAPGGGLLRRVMVTLLEGVSLGALGFEPDGTATGYLAFATLGLFLAGLVLLPGRPTGRNSS